MGNVPVTVGLRTEGTRYCAGDHVMGTVYVSVTKHSQPIQSIFLRLEGCEKSVVHTTTSESPSHHHHHHHNDWREDTPPRHHDHFDESKITFSKMEYPLQTFPKGKIKAGHYEYPFSIKLPDTLPSTMSCKQGQSHCSVEYTLTATYVKPSGTSSLLTSKLTAEQTLIILASPSREESLENTSELLPIEEVPIVTCCCDDKGSVLLETHFDKTVVKPHDTISVRFHGQNESSVNVRKIQVKLESITTWKGRCGNHEERIRKVLDQKELDPSRFPELRKKKKKERRRRRNYNNNGVGSGSGRAYPYDVHWRQTSLHVPGTVQDSYSGRSIQVRHIISVRFLMKDCCTNDVDATTMVRIFQHLPPNANSIPSEPLSSSFGMTTTTTTSNNNATETNPHDTVRPPGPSAPSFVYDEYSDYDNHATAVVPSPPTAPSWREDHNGNRNNNGRGNGSSSSCRRGDDNGIVTIPITEQGRIAYQPNVPTVVANPIRNSSNNNGSRNAQGGGRGGTATVIANPIRNATSTSAFSSSATIPISEALPLNWNAQTAQVVEIPMVDAWIIEEPTPVSSSSNQPWGFGGS